MMGMNYYLRKNPCSACGHSGEKMHIGKNSWGWQFHFHGDRDLGITSYGHWLKLFDDEGKEIINEDGDILTKRAFQDIVLRSLNGKNYYNVISGKPECTAEQDYMGVARNNYGPNFEGLKYSWKDEDGYAFTCIQFS